MFFLHILETEAYSHFRMKESLYTHLQQLLGTPEKVVLLTDANFATQVYPSRKYLGFVKSTQQTCLMKMVIQFLPSSQLLLTQQQRVHQQQPRQKKSFKSISGAEKSTVGFQCQMQKI